VRCAGGLVAGLTLALALLGFPLALMVALLVRRRFLRSSRPGKLGLEDVISGLGRLSCICGLAIVLVAIAVLFLEP
jgi:hypothetical protein